jgi:RNA polymerase sigma-70 factor, ECF subfamily
MSSTYEPSRPVWRDHDEIESAMEMTRHSLLLRARGGDEDAWADLSRLYRPLIRGYLRRQSVPEAEQDDLVQEILLAIVRGLPSFEHSGRRGAFRGWLRSIAFNQSCNYWRSPARRTATVGDSTAVETLARLEDPDDALHRFWEEEHDRYVLRCLIDLIELEFEPATVRAFRRVALEGASGAEAAGELGLTLAAVYACRSRVLKRLKEVAEGLLDDET